jgi:hypothetical protein
LLEIIVMMKHSESQVAFSAPKPSPYSGPEGVAGTTFSSPSRSFLQSESCQSKTDSRCFSELAQRYCLLLDRVVEKRFHRGVPSHAGKLIELSELLGQLQAGAREVVELHARVIEKRLAVVSAGKKQAYLEEGHLLVLELMGHLLSYYRRAYLHSKKGPI